LDGETLPPLATRKMGCAKGSPKDFILFLFFFGKIIAKFCHISSEKNSQIIVFRH
jgi:hypothetical protein